MDVERSTVWTGVLLVSGLSLIALLMLTPPGVPDNRIEYEVAKINTDNPDQTNLAYANFTEDERTVFDAAREAAPESINRTISTSPQSLIPPPDDTAIYNVRDDDEYYALRIRHYTNDVDLFTQQLPRAGLLALGVALVGLAAYRQFGK